MTLKDINIAVPSGKTLTLQSININTSGKTITLSSVNIKTS